MAQRYREPTFRGFDIDPKFVDFGNDLLKNEYPEDRVELVTADLYKLPGEWRGQYDGVTSWQAFIDFPEYDHAITAISRLAPDWIAIQALFYDGPVDVIMWAIDYNNRDEEGDVRYGADGFNIWSLPRFKKQLEHFGYRVHYKRFEIDVDLPKPEDGGTRSYTANLDGQKVIMSGPMYLPWYFIVAERSI